MPKGDGTGPPKETNSRGGRMSGNRAGAGPEGSCVCPDCGEKVPHKRGVPCMHINCPKCGTKMVRE
jgi:hypothetical protein